MITPYRFSLTLLLLCCLSLPLLDLVAADSPPGDRNLSINLVYPPEAFYHNGKGGRVLDVTQPPFNAKGDGVTDDTKALIAAMQFVRDHYELIHGPDFSYCEKMNNRNWIIYLPDGEYLVSDTISQGWPAQAMNIIKGWSHVQSVHVDSPAHEVQLNANNARQVYSEMNWAIRIIGQSRKNTVIRLKDSSSGFAKGSEKAVLTFYLLKQGSNVNNGNFIENVTINTGNNNPGAIGLKWSASNYGGIRNIAILSADGNGRAGLRMGRRNATGYLHDIRVVGFDVGIELTAKNETAVTLEYATLSQQRKTAIRAGGKERGRNCLSARKILTVDAPVAIKADHSAQVVLLDSKLTTTHTNAAALILETEGHLFARNVTLSGYRSAGVNNGKPITTGMFIKEYSSTKPKSLQKDAPLKSLNLPVKDTPLILPEQDLSKWANVDTFGAAGDGITDDTAAIQRAMLSGKPVVYFPKANYVINGTVNIPASVREITWLFGGVHRSTATEPDGPALFCVEEPSKAPLLIHGTITAGGVFLDHEAERPVVLEDIEVWFHHVRGYARRAGMLFPSPAAQETTIWRLYRNTRPEGATKEVFVNNSLFFASDDDKESHALRNVRTWARMVNSEHLKGAQYSFRKSDAWIFGFKSEDSEKLFLADDHSKLEVLGGCFLNWAPRKGPAIISRDSQIFILCYIYGGKGNPETVLQHEANGVVSKLPAEQFPRLTNANGSIVVLQSQ